MASGRSRSSKYRAAPAPMLEYVHQWEDIRRIWDSPTDPYERAFARVRADDEYRRVAIENLRRQAPAHIAKRVARGVFVLWAGEIPFRYSDINQLPPWVIYACWAAQVIILMLAIAGLAALAWSGRFAAACLLASPLVYMCRSSGRGEFDSFCAEP